MGILGIPSISQVSRTQAIIKAGAPAGNQNARKESKLPEDYQLKKSGGSLGRMGYFQSSNEGVRISAQITTGSIFVTRLDAVTPGQGEGGKALERLKAFATATGRRIELTAGADTAELQPKLNAFYEKHGFKKTDDTEHPSFSWEPAERIKATLASRAENILRAAHIKEYTKEDGTIVHEHEDKRKQWTGGEGGIHLKRMGDEYDEKQKGGKWVTHDDKEIPEHVKKMVIPPAWKNVRVAPGPEHDLQAIGEDSKDRVQRIYSEEATQRSANEKFSRNKELIEKQTKIFKQNEANRKSETPKVRENADCMKLIQETGIRPGSDTDTGAEKQAYGATTLEARHVIVTNGKVRLQFVGKKGVDLDIPVDDESTAKMLIERKEGRKPEQKLFSTNDAALRDYSHTLDGGSFKPKDFRTLKGTNTAIEEIAAKPERCKDLKEFKARCFEIAKKVAEKLGNTPAIALQSYINPFVFDTIKPA